MLTLALVVIVFSAGFVAGSVYRAGFPTASPHAPGANAGAPDLGGQAPTMGPPAGPAWTGAQLRRAASHGWGVA